MPMPPPIAAAWPAAAGRPRRRRSPGEQGCPPAPAAVARAAPLPLLVLLLLPGWAAASTQYFEVLQYRGPSQCERMQCQSARTEYCREHLKGFYLKEKGCQNGQICTNCVYGNGSTPTRCKCENPQYSVSVGYGQECNLGKVCTEGECFRPCHTYLHSTQCPSTHCAWDGMATECIKKPPPVPPVVWLNYQVDGTDDTLMEQGSNIIQGTSPAAFPIGFHDLKMSASGYRIQGVLLDNITSMENLFLQLDLNSDGDLSPAEYSRLPSVLSALDDAVASQLQAAATSATPASSSASSAHRRLNATAGPEDDERLEPLLARARQAALAYIDERGRTSAPGRRLQNLTVTAEICSSQRPRKYFCSFDESCKDDCKDCGWKSATDITFSTCVRPTPDSCNAYFGKVYCPTDEMCHATGDCSNCVDRPIVDYSQHMCVAKWWDSEPLPQWTNWVCRFRHKVGMPCINDQDCVHGLRRCLSGVCQPLQPYNANQTCATDFDCPHLGYYCPSDPTGGENPYWVQYCRAQRQENEMCAEDRECMPDMRCNTAEPQPRCRRLFSLDFGMPAIRDDFCKFGWRDRNSACAPPAKSKQAGRSCDADSDCVTTDPTGRSGLCACKAWWDLDDSKYCLPVAGDYKRHSEALRDYLWFKASNCGSFWTEEECHKVFSQARNLKYAIDCETQTLSGGPYLPKASCGIVDAERFENACAMAR